jgi:CDP-diacylglycerol--inositol 3-phosphatidyltransferase
LSFVIFSLGYARILCTVFAFAVAFSHPDLFALFYSIGQGLDGIDGITARAFNQCSRFGALLDMLTDRMSTAALLIVLSHLYANQWAFFTFLIVLDIVSHWFQMYR